MSSVYCTISTKSHLWRVLALLSSLEKFNHDLRFFCLVVDASEGDQFPEVENLRWLYPENVKQGTRAKEIFQKYPAGSDQLRWALKPSLMIYLLKSTGESSVIFCDSDLYFVDEYKFIEYILDENDILLSPHFRISDPEADAPWFTTNFKDGIFNGGFVAAADTGLPALEWWEKATAFACEINFAEGRYVDQKYLDMMPVLFERTGILRHRGCNIAYWNKYENKRSLRDGKLWINEKWPAVFIHFTNDLIQSVKRGGKKH